MNAETAQANSRPQQPWLHELAICVDGNATALSARSGVMGGRGTGLFVDDRRVLSVLETCLGDDVAVSVVSSARGDKAAFWGSARRHGNAGADPTVEILSERTVRRGGMSETVSVVNRADAPVSDTLWIRLGGDGAALHDVKTGLPRGPLLTPQLDGDRVHWSDDRHDVWVSATPAPTSRQVADDGSVTLGFELDVARGARGTVRLDVDPVRVSSSAFDAGPGSHLVHWDDAGIEAADSRLRETFETAFTDLRHLLMSGPEAPDDVFAGAGTPWYLTLFGRDSLWAARLTLPFGTELAAGTLRALARRQGVKDDPLTAEAPGKILHEVRREVFDDGEAGLHLPTVYYGTVDATALWIILLHDAWRHGLAEAAVRELLPNLQRAVAWMEGATRVSDDGLLRYVDEAGTGLANQGWKDSGDSMRRRDGSVAPAPIALIEAQGYAIEAARGAAALYEVFGLDGATALRQLADDLTARVRDTYWVTSGETSYPAMAVDGDGALVDGVGSNMGHVLGTGAFDADEARRVVDVLVSDDMFGRYGINTLSRSNPAYNPIGYHSGSVWTHDTAICAVGMSREGHRDEAVAVARSLVEASAAFDYRWPELYSGESVLRHPAPYPASCRPQAWSAASAAAIVTAVLGLDIDVPGARVTVRPADGSPFGAMTVNGLRFGDASFSISVDGAGRVSAAGLPDGVSFEVR